jgi:hypothetical protein
MTSIDPWPTIVQSLENSSHYYKSFSKVLEKRLNVGIDIDELANAWRLSIVEKHEESPLWNDYDKFYNAISWSTEQLITWPNVSKMSFKSWIFDSQKDAEKFKTLFVLKWQK